MATPNLKILTNQISEKEIKSQILHYLWFNRIFAWPNDSVGIYDARKGVFRKKGKFHINGVPDILGMLPHSGRFLAIEVKTPKGVVSDSQKEFIMKATDNGAIVFVARSLDDVIRVMGDYVKKV